MTMMMLQINLILTQINLIFTQNSVYTFNKISSFLCTDWLQSSWCFVELNNLNMDQAKAEYNQ